MRSLSTVDSGPCLYGPDFLTFTVESDPVTFKQAMSSPEALFWEEAVNSEIDSIMQNHTWELVDLPQGCKPLRHKWVFKRKMKTNGMIDKYKARLVIKGLDKRRVLTILTHMLRPLAKHPSV